MDAAERPEDRRAFRISIPLVYVETTIPPGMTIAEYRATRPRRRRRRRLRRLLWRILGLD